MKNEQEYDLVDGLLFQTTKDLIEICNKVYPQLDIGRFSNAENKALRDNIYLISEITQKNLNLMYPNRPMRPEDK
jgi:hypothetical protein